jgi:hypothetical protein
MKKNIMLIFIALIGLILVFNGHSWAASNKSGSYQKWHKSSNAFSQPDRSRNLARGIQYDRPEHRFIPRLHQPDNRRAPYRYAPKNRPWLRQPFYRPFHPNRYFWQHHHGSVNSNYYSIAERYYAPADRFSAAAAISNTGFLFSVGVSETN